MLQGITYPLYTSVNNATNNADISNINGYRNANKYTVLLMAMGYSKVPNTNRYVVRYVDQKLANGGFISASAYANGTMTIKANNIFSIADNAINNKLIAKNFDMTLRDQDNNPTKQTIFKLTSGDPNSTSNGSLIVKQNTGNNLFFQGTYYNRVSGTNDSLLGNDRESLVESAIKADVSVKDKNPDTSKIRDSLANLVKSKFNDPNNYITLPAGYYIFVDKDKIVYFPSDYNITQVQQILDTVNLGNLSSGINKYSLNQKGNPVFTNLSINDININKYEIQINKNVKLGGNFLFVSSYGKVDRSSSNYFGNKDVKIILGGSQGNNSSNNNSVIFYAQDAFVTIDGVVKGEGTLAVLNTSPNAPSTVNNAFAVNYADENSNLNAFYPYRWNGTNWVNNNNQSVSIVDNNAGNLVVRFDQVKSSDDKLALLVDNNLYINPLSYNTQDLNWFDQIFAYALTNWANNNNNISVMKGNSTVSNPSEYNSAIQYLFDQKKWDFDKMWKNGGNFNIQGNYKAQIGSILGNHPLTSSFISRYQGNGINPDSPTGSPWGGDPSNNFNSHLLEIRNIKGYTIKLYEVTNTSDTSKSDVTFTVSENDGISYSSTLTMNRNSALALLDSIDGTADNGSENLTMAKLAWITTAFIKNDSKVIEEVIGNSSNWDNATGIDKVYNNSKDFVKDRLEGLYNSYLNVLNKEELNNDLPISIDPYPYLNRNPNYFPFLHKRFVGDKASNYGGALNDLSGRGRQSLLVSNGYSERDVKLQGMVFVGNSLKAKTGSYNNLLFRGNLIVGNTKISNSGAVSIKGVKDTTFWFDLNSIDVNLLAGSVINLVPVLYRQESVISK